MVDRAPGLHGRAPLKETNMNQFCPDCGDELPDEGLYYVDEEGQLYCPACSEARQ